MSEGKGGEESRGRVRGESKRSRLVPQGEIKNRPRGKATSTMEGVKDGNTERQHRRKMQQKAEWEVDKEGLIAGQQKRRDEGRRGGI